MKKKKSITVGVRIDPEDYEKLKTVVLAKRRTMSGVLRDVLKMYLRNEEEKRVLLDMTEVERKFDDMLRREFSNFERFLKSQVFNRIMNVLVKDALYSIAGRQQINYLIHKEEGTNRARIIVQKAWNFAVDRLKTEKIVPVMLTDEQYRKLEQEAKNRNLTIHEVLSEKISKWL